MTTSTAVYLAQKSAVSLFVYLGGYSRDELLPQPARLGPDLVARPRDIGFLPACLEDASGEGDDGKWRRKKVLCRHAPVMIMLVHQSEVCELNGGRNPSNLITVNTNQHQTFKVRTTRFIVSTLDQWAQDKDDLTGIAGPF